MKPQDFIYPSNFPIEARLTSRPLEAPERTILGAAVQLLSDLGKPKTSKAAAPAL
jgi:hypothetical protein